MNGAAETEDLRILVDCCQCGAADAFEEEEEQSSFFPFFVFCLFFWRERGY